MKLKSQVNARLCSLQYALNEQLPSTKFSYPHRTAVKTLEQHSFLSNIDPDPESPTPDPTPRFADTQDVIDQLRVGLYSEKP